MPLSYEQGLAFIENYLGSPKVKAHLLGELGSGKVPSLADFGRQDAEAFERCEGLLSFVAEATNSVDAVHRQRPRQTKIDLDGKDGTKVEVEVKRRDRKAAKA